MSVFLRQRLQRLEEALGALKAERGRVLDLDNLEDLTDEELATAIRARGGDPEAMRAEVVARVDAEESRRAEAEAVNREQWRVNRCQEWGEILGDPVALTWGETWGVIRDLPPRGQAAAIHPDQVTRAALRAAVDRVVAP